MDAHAAAPFSSRTAPQKPFASKLEKPLSRQLIDWLIGLSLAIAAISFAVQTWIVSPAFAKIEHEGAVRDIDRCTAGLNRDIELISNQVSDWASWDDTYEYVVDRNKAYAEANLIEESFPTAKINLLALYNMSRERVWGEIRDYESLEEIEAPEFWETVQDSANALIDHEDVRSQKDGIVMTGQGPILVSSRPIITSKREGPVRGALIMGRFLDEKEIAGLGERTQVDLKIWPLQGEAALPPEETELLRETREWSEPFIEEYDSKTLRAYAQINDVLRRPALLLRVDVPRVITAQGRLSAGLAILASLAGGLVIVLAAGWVIQRRVVGPIQTVASHARHVGQDDDLKARLNLDRGDEIGVLAEVFDRMMENLAEARKRVLESAHRAGMADVASEVLHNVGNVVNTANTAVEALEEQAENFRPDGLAKALDLLGEKPEQAAVFFQRDPRAPKLIPYLRNFGEMLSSERAHRRKEIARLAEAVRHIRTIVATQQGYATRAEFVQEVDLAELVRETLVLNRDRMKAVGIEVETHLEDLPEIPLNKAKMSQVLMNLVKNAIEAMEDDRIQTRRLAILVRAFEDRGIGMEIRDTGRGIAGEAGARLFTQGFTTKPGGNGIGLHYSFNAIRSMGGQLTAASEGEGRGASFRIWLPFAKEGRSDPVAESESHPRADLPPQEEAVV